MRVNRIVLTACAALLMLVSMPALGGKNEVINLVVNETMTGIVSKDVTNPASTKAYLVINTSAEVATASLVVTIRGTLGPGGTALYTVCTLPAITTNTTTVALIGDLAAPGEGIGTVCDFPLPRDAFVLFNLSGAGASFVVDAWLQTISQ